MQNAVMTSGRRNQNLLGKCGLPLKTWLQNTIRNQKLGQIHSEVSSQKRMTLSLMEKVCGFS